MSDPGDAPESSELSRWIGGLNVEPQDVPTRCKIQLAFLLRARAFDAQRSRLLSIADGREGNGDGGPLMLHALGTKESRRALRRPGRGVALLGISALQGPFRAGAAWGRAL